MTCCRQLVIEERSWRKLTCSIHALCERSCLRPALIHFALRSIHSIHYILFSCMCCGFMKFDAPHSIKFVGVVWEIYELGLLREGTGKLQAPCQWTHMAVHNSYISC